MFGLFLAVHLADNFHNFFISGDDGSIILLFMRKSAIGTIFIAIFGISAVAAAFFAQRIQRTIAKQAAEAFCIAALMAGEIFTCAVLKEIVVCHSLTPLI